MPERGSTFGLSVWRVRLSVLRSFVCVVVAAVVASTGAAARVEACTVKPNGPAPQGRHWHYMVDRAKHQCWHLGPLGHAAQRSATRRLRHRVAVAHNRPAASETAAAGPTATPAAANGADALAPALPPTEAAGVSERWLTAEPAQQGSARETRSPDTIAPSLALMPAPAAMPAPALMAAAERAEATQPAATVRPVRAAAPAGGHDHTLAAIVVAAVLLMIAGPVLWAMWWWGGRKARGQTPSASPVRPARVGEPTPLILARTAVRRRRPPDHGTPHEDPGATMPSP